MNKYTSVLGELIDRIKVTTQLFRKAKKQPNTFLQIVTKFETSIPEDYTPDTKGFTDWTRYLREQSVAPRRNELSKNSQ